MSAKAAGVPVIGIDLGGTKVLAGVVGPDNMILGRAKRPTPSKEGAEAILAAILEAVYEAIDLAEIELDDVAGVGVGTPGPLDADKGIILFSANMNVRDFAIGPDLAAAIGKPVLVRNDVRVGGYGEFKLGAGRGYRNMIAAFVGTGIGGCVILNGEIVNGATGNAGELGHIIVKANGAKCGCGMRGCMEAYASRSAITRRIGKAVKKGSTTSLAETIARKSGRIKSGELAKAFTENDLVAMKEVHRAARFLGLGLGGLLNVLGPEIAIIGGGVVEALGPSYMNLVETAIRAHTLVDKNHVIKIVPAMLGDNAGLLGAALMAREQFAAK